MSRDELIRKLAPPPDWLRNAWAGAASRGIATLTPGAIDAELAVYRASKAKNNE